VLVLVQEAAADLVIFRNAGLGVFDGPFPAASEPVRQGRQGG
jgi:hypothetical protein